MAGYVAGVDLGGTKIYTALADMRGCILSEIKVPTNAREGPDAVINRIVETINKVRRAAGLEKTAPLAIGVGSPGPLDPATGVVFSSPNLGWRNVSLKKKIEELTGVPAAVENDANLAALGEYRQGAGRGSRHMVYITVSTGIGCGLVLDGRIFHGAGGGAGEAGHMVLCPDGPMCGCGRRGCLEALASGTAIAARGAELAAQGRGTAIVREAGGNPADITAVSVSRAAASGDAEAIALISEAGTYLGMGLAGVVNLINPEILVLGGSVMNAGNILWDSMEKELSRRSLGPAYSQVKVVRAALGERSGVIGAVELGISLGSGSQSRALGIGNH